MTVTTLPGLVAGTWAIDPSHSHVAFSVRHLMVSKVRGQFDSFEGQLTIDDDLLASSVTASIDVSSINTNDAQRDGHLLSADFFDVEQYPAIGYRSTGLRAEGSDFAVDGELTVHGVTKPVSLALEFNGVGADPWGGTRAGYTATTEISRSDFGLEFNIPLDGGGVVVGDKISITLEIEAVLQP